MAAKELADHKDGWKGKAGSFLADARVLASHPVYVLTVAGTAIYVGADLPAHSLMHGSVGIRGALLLCISYEAAGHHCTFRIEPLRKCLCRYK